MCWPSQDLVAANASLSDTAVRVATQRLEAKGYLRVERSQGRSAHHYLARLPATANELRRSEWATTNDVRRSTANQLRGSKDHNSEAGALNTEPHAANPEGGSDESAKARKRARSRGARPVGGAAPRASGDYDRAEAYVKLVGHEYSPDVLAEDVRERFPRLAEGDIAELLAEVPGPGKAERLGTPDDPEPIIDDDLDEEAA